MLRRKKKEKSQDDPQEDNTYEVVENVKKDKKKFRLSKKQSKKVKATKKDQPKDKGESHHNASLQPDLRGATNNVASPVVGEEYVLENDTKKGATASSTPRQSIPDTSVQEIERLSIYENPDQDTPPVPPKGFRISTLSGVTAVVRDEEGGLEEYDDVVPDEQNVKGSLRNSSGSATGFSNNVGQHEPEEYDDVVLPMSTKQDQEEYDDIPVDEVSDQETKPAAQSRSSWPSKSSHKIKPSADIYLKKSLPKLCIDGDATLPSVFDHPWGICISPIDGDIYITDVDRSQIIRFDKNGKFKSAIGLRGNGDGEFNYPTGITFSQSGRLLVCDTKNQRIQVLDPEGRFIQMFANHGQFARPSGIAVGPDDTVYITDQVKNQVQMWTQNGKFLKSFGSEGSGPGEFQLPHDIAVTPSGEVVVVDTNNHRLQTFSPDGTYLTSIARGGSKPGELSSPKAVCVDHGGNMIVSDCHNDRIQIFSEKGRFLHGIGGKSRGSEEGEFDQPAGVAVDDENTLYICDYYNRRIQIF